MTTRSGPLSDVRVLDLTQALAGPYCTMLLADLGADVIKIEPPTGDMSRPMGPPPPDREGCDYGGYFASVNRNKRSVVLDLKTEGGRDALLKLVKTADAIVENAKTGVMDRMGIGYEVLRERNPKLVYAAVRGFGDPRTGRGPYAVWPAFDVVAQSMGGLVAVTGPIGSQGVKVGVGVGDIYPGTLAALGVVADWTKAASNRDVVAALGGRVPCGPVNSAKNIFEDSHPRARNMLVQVEQPGNNPLLVIAGSPIKMTTTPPRVYARPPLLGEHTQEILLS